MEDIEVEDLSGTTTQKQTPHPRENSKNSYHIYDANAAAFVNAVKDGTLACLDVSAAGGDGKVYLQPPAVYDYETGKCMKGINGMLIQTFSDGNKRWGHDENGNIPVTTPSAAGKGNYDWDSHFSLTTVSKNGDEYIKKLYNVIPLSAVKDKEKMNLKAPVYQTRRGSHTPHRDLICSPAAGCSPTEFFAQYAAATKIGATFVTDSETISRVKDETMQRFSANTWKDKEGRDTGRIMSGAVYSFGNEFEKRAAEIVSSMFDRAKAPADRSFHQEKERAAEIVF